MHVILRYEIERGLMNGEIAVQDVPRIWNEKMQEYLGAVPADDAQGCPLHSSPYTPIYSL